MPEWGLRKSKGGDDRFCWSQVLPAAETISPRELQSPQAGTAPPLAGQAALGALLPAPAAAPGALPGSPEHSGRLEAARVGGTRQKAAEISLPAGSGPPSSTEGTRGLRIVIPCSTLGARKENKSGAQARPLEEKEGQTLRPGRRVQRPPRPLRECSRGEERPSCLLMGALTSPHP